MTARRRAVPLAALVVLTASVVGGIALGSPAVAVVTPLAALWGWHAWRQALVVARTQERRRRRVERVDELIQQLKAGASLGAALRADGSAPRFDRAAVERAGSGRVEETTEGDVLVATTVAVLAARGGAALPSLERLSDTLRSADAATAEARAQAGQATASATVLAVLPGVFALVLAAADARLRTFYLVEPLGALCLAASVALSHLGWWLMQHLIGSA